VRPPSAAFHRKPQALEAKQFSNVPSGNPVARQLSDATQPIGIKKRQPEIKT
jgi:hypothetical protein